VLWAAVDWEVIGTWVGVGVSVLAIIIGIMVSFGSGRSVRQRQRGGRGSVNYQAAGDLHVKVDRPTADR